ncbi:MAG: competence protein ComEA [Thermomicrobiales bacterium]|nr:competence protein ComEA [Thermomicrobiales bacterium]
MAKLVVAGIACMAVGIALGVLVVGVLDDRAAPAIVIDDPRPDATIVVSVEGAVATPGVYHLKADARVQDALNAAGGPTAHADLARVNPAARLRDQERLYIPTLPSTGEPASGGATAAASATAGGSPAGIININTAAVELLDTLPGIGPAIAARIVAYREANGPFRSVDELAEVEGISLAMVDELRSLITV